MNPDKKYEINDDEVDEGFGADCDNNRTIDIEQKHKSSMAKTMQFEDDF